MILLVLIICALILNYMNVAAKCEIIAKGLDKLERDILLNDEEKITKSLSDVLLAWEDYRSPLLSSSNHKYLDDISLTFIRIQSKVESKRYTEAIEEIKVGKLHLKDITSNEFPSWVNIF